MTTTSKTPLDVRKLAPGIYALETLFWGKALNLYLFKGKKTLLCDTGAAGMVTDLILPRLEREGLIDNDIDFVLNAHSHIDHFGGNAELKARFPHVVTLAHARELTYIEAPSKQYAAVYERWPELFHFDEEFREEDLTLAGKGVCPDIGLQGDELIELGGLSLQVVNLPGHSFGDIGIYDAEHRILYSGEALLAEGAKDDSGEVVAPPYYESASDYSETLVRVRSLNFDCLCTSHFGVIQGEDIQKHIEESVAFFLTYEQNLLTVLKGAGSGGLTTEQAARTFADECSPFEFRLETMQLVTTHLAHLEKNGRARQVDDKWFPF